MIYLVNMPMQTCNSPSIVLGLFKSLFNQAGMDCKTFDLPLLLASQVGHKQYTCVANSHDDLNILHSLWAPYVWENNFHGITDDFLGSLSKFGLRPSQEGAQLIVSSRGENGWIENFLKTSMELLFNSVPPAAVGFTCTATQVLPSLALGLRIKKKNRNIKVVYGGRAFFDEMGWEYIKKIPWVDAVATGEADDTVVPLFKALTEGREPADLNGILYRCSDDKVRSGPACRPVSQEVFASLPDPEYDDFFELAGETGLYGNSDWCQNFFLTIEGARGCLWGQKCQCTFCGVNGRNLKIRKKSGGQFYKSIEALAKKHSIFTIFSGGSTFLDEYHDTLISKLAARRPEELLDIIIEVRENLGRQKLERLVKAGTTRLQVGIANLSSDTLRLFRKGSNGLQNIYFLKLCRQYGVHPTWFYLTRVPGEQPSSYSRVAKLIPQILHLQPPGNRTPIPLNLEKCSKYYNEKKWVKNIRPKPWYSYQFPKDRFDLCRIAYVFDAEWENTIKPEAYDGLNEEICRWWDAWYTQSEVPILSMRDITVDNCIEIFDTRDAKDPCHWRLEPAVSSVYKLLDDPITVDAVKTRLQESTEERRCSILEHDVQPILEELVACGLAVREKEMYLGLAIPCG